MIQQGRELALRAEFQVHQCGGPTCSAPTMPPALTITGLPSAMYRADVNVSPGAFSTQCAKETANTLPPEVMDSHGDHLARGGELTAPRASAMTRWRLCAYQGLIESLVQPIISFRGSRGRDPNSASTARITARRRASVG